MTPTDIAAIEARLSAATPGPWGWVSRGSHDALCAADGAVVHSDGSAAGEYGPDIDVSGPDANLIAHAPTDIADLLAEVRTLSHRDPTESEMESALGSADEAFIGGTVRRCRNCRRPVFGGPTWCVSCVARAEVRALTAERDALRARVAELEEAAKWRHYPDVEPPDGLQIEAVIAGDRVIGRWRATLGEVSSYGRGWSGYPFDWRPLGPGPEVK